MVSSSPMFSNCNHFHLYWNHQFRLYYSDALLFLSKCKQCRRYSEDISKSLMTPYHAIAHNGVIYLMYPTGILHIGTTLNSLLSPSMANLKGSITFFPIK